MGPQKSQERKHQKKKYRALELEVYDLFCFSLSSFFHVNIRKRKGGEEKKSAPNYHYYYYYTEATFSPLLIGFIRK